MKPIHLEKETSVNQRRGMPPGPQTVNALAKEAEEGAEEEREEELTVISSPLEKRP